MRAEFSDVQASTMPATGFNNVFVICHIVQQPDTRMRVKLGTATPHDYSTRFIGSHHDCMSRSPLETVLSCLNVCFWHLADIDADAEHVRFWGQSGHGLAFYFPQPMGQRHQRATPT